MPEPLWTVRDAGSPIANGDYFPNGTYDYRPCFEKLGGGAYLFWWDPLRLYFLYAIKMSDNWYIGANHGYDLPANPWEIGGGGHAGAEPPPVLSPYQPPPPPLRPQAILLLTEGQIDPAAILDPTPTLAWTYIPANGGPPQDAYQIHIATSYAHLEAHMPDVWDSGIVQSDQNQIVYAGDPLADREIHFWAVRVRDESGIWSEDW